MSPQRESTQGLPKSAGGGSKPNSQQKKMRGGKDDSIKC